MSGQRSTSPSPTLPQGKDGHPSQRGMLSIVMLLVSIVTLSIAMIGGAKMALDLFSPSKVMKQGANMKIGEGLSADGAKSKKMEQVDISPKPHVFAPAVTLAIAYGVGWFTAMLGIRVYGNLILPILINLITWACLAGICYLYLQILKRLYGQEYKLANFVKYVVVMIAGLAAMVGLHLIVEDHNLRPFAIPLLIICMFHLGLIVYRYVFANGNDWYLLGDLFFLFGMSGFSMLMLAHVGLLDTLRTRFTNYFDRNSVAIRTQD